MIQLAKYDYFGKECYFITIDLSDTKHKTRILEIAEELNIATGEYRYRIQAKWTPHKYHPNVSMTESDFLQFAKVVSALADEITERKTAQP